ncbi:helix-turn-helix domain-containing protein [Conexibacter arvalis]|uniref:Transcriptional regulator with XRE-family HTH domain n=1 Tax=Conexibacter arvalis TaxID=912552 RepID=A0A840IHF0_9ACTN|nr:transcriptional regulator with XRE-family HTH domain [Conexibacter arvalis]
MPAPLPNDVRALATAVRELRARKALKQEEVGAAAGLSRNYMTSLESGRMNPSFTALVHVSRALDVPLSELVSMYEERLSDA